ncbi:MAG: hypothetical protein LBU05_05290, partial [Bifidobacteriaceae bacterium]|nr:hypothetical protein [Bifidobacteriaceae bacterium]
MKSIRQRIALTLAAVLAVGFVSLADFRGADAAPPPKTAEFTIAYSTNANGAIITIGNSLLTCPDAVGAPCLDARGGGSWDNNSFRMVDIDVDGDPSTYNSSSSQLNLPDGAKVLFAGLFWGARLDKGETSGSATTRAGDPALADKIKFKVPKGSYENLTGVVLAQNSGQKNAYQSYKDVTELVRAAGNGEYWGADVETGTGLDRYAGWALTVV